MLHGDTDPIVSKPTPLQRLDEWDAHEHACDHDKVGKREDECISRDESTECRRQDRSFTFPRFKGCPAEQEEQRDPKEAVEASELVFRGLFVEAIQARCSWSESDERFELAG